MDTTAMMNAMFVAVGHQMVAMATTGAMVAMGLLSVCWGFAAGIRPRTV